jgi:hypothetical protein
MANELQEVHYPNTDTLYTTLRNTIGQVLRISTLLFEAWGTGGRSYGDYDIALVGDQGCLYSGDMPVIVAGIYFKQSYVKIGDDPAVGDIPLPRELIIWNGVSVLNFFDSNGRVKIQISASSGDPQEWTIEQDFGNMLMFFKGKQVKNVNEIKQYDMTDTQPSKRTFTIVGDVETVEKVTAP